jgi:hypothetical protein
VNPQPIGDYIFTDHARIEIQRRGLSEEMVRAILLAPEQRLEVRPGREVLQSKISSRQPEKAYLLRVIVDTDRHPAEVVTAYRTSKIEKYWREP